MSNTQNDCEKIKRNTSTIKNVSIECIRSGIINIYFYGIKAQSYEGKIIVQNGLSFVHFWNLSESFATVSNTKLYCFNVWNGS